MKCGARVIDRSERCHEFLRLHDYAGVLASKSSRKTLSRTSGIFWHLLAVFIQKLNASLEVLEVQQTMEVSAWKRACLELTSAWAVAFATKGLTDPSFHVSAFESGIEVGNQKVEVGNQSFCVFCTGGCECSDGGELREGPQGMPRRPPGIVPRREGQRPHLQRQELRRCLISGSSALSS